jgi:hypothetical protein
MSPCYRSGIVCITEHLEIRPHLATILSWRRKEYGLIRPWRLYKIAHPYEMTASDQYRESGGGKKTPAIRGKPGSWYACLGPGGQDRASNPQDSTSRSCSATAAGALDAKHRTRANLTLCEVVHTDGSQLAGNPVFMSPIGGGEEEGPHMQRPITISIVITIISLFALLRTVRDAITQEYALAPHLFLPFMILEPLW